MRIEHHARSRARARSGVLARTGPATHQRTRLRPRRALRPLALARALLKCNLQRCPSHRTPRTQRGSSITSTIAGVHSLTTLPSTPRMPRMCCEMQFPIIHVVLDAVCLSGERTCSVRAPTEGQEMRNLSHDCALCLATGLRTTLLPRPLSICAPQGAHAAPQNARDASPAFLESSHGVSERLSEPTCSFAAMSRCRRGSRGRSRRAASTTLSATGALWPPLIPACRASPFPLQTDRSHRTSFRALNRC